MTDMVKKGRNAPGKWINKLTVEQVLEIRRMSGVIAVADMANKYNVQKQTIKSVIRRVNWKHV
jgi:uncharacterized protein YjcR